MKSYSKMIKLLFGRLLTLINVAEAETLWISSTIFARLQAGLSPLRGGGKSGQHRATHPANGRTLAIARRESATENNSLAGLPLVDLRGDGENVG